MQEILINQINQGGMADSKYEGEANSVSKIVGIDLHSEPGLLKANYKLKKDSGSTIDEFCKCIVTSSNGNVYFFSSESGKVWRKKNDTYTLHYTTAPTGGEAKILGAAEYKGYIYWATENYLFRVQVSSDNWGTDAVEWQEFAQGDKDYHPMAIARDGLYIGDDYFLAQVKPAPADPYGEHIFTDSALDLMMEHKIKSLSAIDIQLAIGTYVDNEVNKTTIYRWDTWTYTWNMEDEIDEVGINAFIPVDNYFFVQAGNTGSIYSYDYNMLYLTKRIPGDWDGQQSSRVLPNATAFFKQRPLFGVSKEEGAVASGAIPGVYSFATMNPRIYHRVMAIEYITSTYSDNTIIGAIGVKGNQLYVSWKDGAETGIDIIDYENRYTDAYLESRVIYLDRKSAHSYTDFSIGYVELPENCNIKAYIKQNYAETWTEIILTQDEIRKKFYSDLRLESNVVEFKIELIGNGANTPSVDYISLTGEEHRG